MKTIKMIESTHPTMTATGLLMVFPNVHGHSSFGDDKSEMSVVDSFVHTDVFRVNIGSGGINCNSDGM